VTHLTNIVDLDMIAGIQLRSDNGDLFQRLREFVTEVCQRLDSITDRGDGGYAKPRMRNAITPLAALRLQITHQ